MNRNGHSLRLWQRLELTGAAFVLVALFAQLFAALNIDDRLKETDSMIQEARLKMIYDVLRTGKEGSVSWEDVEEQFAGPKKSGDNHFRFEEVSGFIRNFAAITFLLGAVLSLLGKWLQYRAENIRIPPDQARNDVSLSSEIAPAKSKTP